MNYNDVWLDLDCRQEVITASLAILILEHENLMLGKSEDAIEL